MTRNAVAILVILLSTAIVLVSRAQEHMKFCVLAIEYIGPSDHLIGPIVISDSKEGADWFTRAVLKKTIAWDYTPKYVVSASLMKSLISKAEVHRRIAQHGQDNSQETPQTVSVTIVTLQGRSVFLIDQKRASTMLESFKRTCTDSRPLRSELSQFQEEILP